MVQIRGRPASGAAVASIHLVVGAGLWVCPAVLWLYPRGRPFLGRPFLIRCLLSVPWQGAFIHARFRRHAWSVISVAAAHPTESFRGKHKAVAWSKRHCTSALARTSSSGDHLH